MLDRRGQGVGALTVDLLLSIAIVTGGIVGLHGANPAGQGIVEGERAALQGLATDIANMLRYTEWGIRIADTYARGENVEIVKQQFLDEYKLRMTDLAVANVGGLRIVVLGAEEGYAPPPVSARDCAVVVAPSGRIVQIWVEVYAYGYGG